MTGGRSTPPPQGHTRAPPADASPAGGQASSRRPVGARPWPGRDPTHATCVPPRRPEGGSSLVMPLRDASRPQELRPTGPPRGSGAATPSGALRAIDSSARPRSGGPVVRAACGSSLSLTWLPRGVVLYEHRAEHAAAQAMERTGSLGADRQPTAAPAIETPARPDRLDLTAVLMLTDVPVSLC